jgi:hypothetical protein
LESLKSTALGVANTEDSKVVMGIVLLLKVLFELILEFLAGVRIDLSCRFGDFSTTSDLSNSDCALLSLNSLFLQGFKVSLDVKCPEAVDQYD